MYVPKKELSAQLITNKSKSRAENWSPHFYMGTELNGQNKPEGYTVKQRLLIFDPEASFDKMIIITEM